MAMAMAMGVGMGMAMAMAMTTYPVEMKQLSSLPSVVGVS